MKKGSVVISIIFFVSLVVLLSALCGIYVFDKSQYDDSGLSFANVQTFFKLTFSDNVYRPIGIFLASFVTITIAWALMNLVRGTNG